MFSSTVGLYPGDEVRVVGVPVGKIDSIQPRADDVKVTMSVSDDVRVPAEARAIIVSPNLVAARFIQLTPAYDVATGGPTLADGATIGLDRTGVPVEWDEVKDELTKLSASWDPRHGLQGPLTAFVDQAATRSTATVIRSATRFVSCRRPPAGSVTRVPICSAR